MVKVAVLGYGIVGGGVVELLLRQPGYMTKALPKSPRLGAVLDIRDFPESPCPELFVKDFSVIENDPEIRIVAETIGGVRAAYEFTRRALTAGKHVVTSSKELVAAHGAELLALAARRRVNYLFEASVGGGIPIIRPLSLCLSANRVTEVTGILNGTTNYILTRMTDEGCTMLDALREAKLKGYAEADPTDDLEGKDTARKIAILASLAFGRHVYPNYVPTQGISYVTRNHIAEAAEAGHTVKLVGRAWAREGGRVSVLTAPHVIRAEHPLHGIRDVNNAVLIHGDATGEVMFYGRGAGRMPTASAVLADIYYCAGHLEDNQFPIWEDTDEDITLPAEPGPMFRFGDGTELRLL